MLPDHIQRTQGHRARLVIACIAGGLALALFYAGSLVIRDEVAFHDGDLASWILAHSATIRDFPTPGAAPGPKALRYRAGDGPAPARVVLSFDSREPPSSILDALSTYCVSRGYQVIPGGNQRSFGLQCLAPDYLISITLTPRMPGGASAVAEFEEKA
jgi:hypothetical protein